MTGVYLIHFAPAYKHAQLHLYMDTALDFTLEDVDELAF